MDSLSGIFQPPTDYPTLFLETTIVPNIDAEVLDRQTQKHRHMQDYGFLEDWPLSDPDHSDSWFGQMCVIPFLSRANS